MMKTKFNATGKLPVWLGIWVVIIVAASILALIFGLTGSPVFNRAATETNYKTFTVSYDPSLTATNGEQDENVYVDALQDICDKALSDRKINVIECVRYRDAKNDGKLEYKVAVDVKDETLNGIKADIETAIVGSEILTINGEAMSAFEYSIHTHEGQPAYEYVWRAAVSGAVMIAIACVYVLVRYSVPMGLATLIAGLGDVMVVLGLTIILRIPITTAFPIMAVYAVLYSILISLIGFTPVRKLLRSEEYKAMDVKQSMQEVGGAGNGNVLLFSGVTALLGVILAVVFLIVGNMSIVSVAATVIVSAVASCYSALCIKPALVTVFRVQGKKMKDKRLAKQRLAEKEEE